MLNPYVILGAIIFWMVSIGGAGFQGYRMGIDHEKASKEEDERIVQEIQEKVALVTAEAISKIKIDYKIINQTLEKEINENTVYSDCVHSDIGLQSLNDALEGRSTSNRKLPTSDATGR